MLTGAAHSVVPPSARDHTVRPWFLVPFEALPLPVPWGAAGFSLLGIGAYLAFGPEMSESALAAFGSLERVVVLIWVFIGYSIAGASIAIRSALRDLAALRSELDCSKEEFGLLVRAITQQRVASAVAAALVGVVVWWCIGLYFASARGAGPPGLVSLIQPVMVLAQWVVAVSALWVVLSISLVFRWIGAHLPRVDLFDLEALAPFQRVGLRLALISFGFCAVRFLLAVRPGGNIGYLAVTSSALIVLGSLALLLPLWGVRARIAAEKRRELAAVQDDIRRERARASDGSARASRELLNLLEYKERVESVREWLFDAPVFFRFLLYLGIPVLGWLGGAVVERGFDTLVSP